MKVNHARAVGGEEAAGADPWPPEAILHKALRWALQALKIRWAAASEHGQGQSGHLDHEACRGLSSWMLHKEPRRALTGPQTSAAAAAQS